MAETSLGKLYVEVAAKTDQLEKELSNLKSKVSKDADDMSSAFGAVNSKVLGLVGSFLAVDQAINFGKASIEASIESQQAIAKVEQALKTTGGVAGYTSEQLSKMAGELSEISGIDDDKILNDTTAQLLTFTNIAGTSFDRAQKAALDLSAVLGSDLKGQTIQLAKALERPVEGLAGLQRVGITFTQHQQDMIKSFMAQNDIMSAQNVILTEIETKYGGQAKVANDAKGGIDNLKVAFGNLQESIGGATLNGLAPFISKATEIIKSITPVRTNLDDATEATFNQRVAFETLVGTYTRLRDETNKTDGQTKLYKDTIEQLKNQYPDYLSKLDLEKGKYDDITKAIDATRASLIEKAKTDAIVATQKDYLQNIADAESDIAKKTVEIEKLKAELKQGVKSYTDKVLTGNDQAQGYKITGLEQDIAKAKEIISKATDDLKVLGNKYSDVLNNVLSGNTKSENTSGTGGGTDDKEDIVANIIAEYEKLKIQYAEINKAIEEGNYKEEVKNKLIKERIRLLKELKQYENDNTAQKQREKEVADIKDYDKSKSSGKISGVPKELKATGEVPKPEGVKETTFQLQTQLALSYALTDAFSSAGQSLASGLAQSVSLFKEANSLGEQFLNTLVQVAIQSLALSAIGNIGSGGLLGLVSGFFGAHNGGTFVNNGSGIVKMATGGSYMVPQGYPNDSFIMGVETGERVTVTPANQMSATSGGSDALLKQVVAGVNALNINLARKDFSPVIVNKVDGKELVKSQIAPATNKLKKSGVDLDGYN